MNLIFTIDNIEKEKVFLSNQEQEKLEINKANLPTNLKVGDKILLHLEPLDKSSQKDLSKKILNTALNADN